MLFVYICAHIFKYSYFEISIVKNRYNGKGSRPLSMMRFKIMKWNVVCDVWWNRKCKIMRMLSRMFNICDSIKLLYILLWYIKISFCFSCICLLYVYNIMWLLRVDECCSLEMFNAKVRLLYINLIICIF